MLEHRFFTYFNQKCVRELGNLQITHAQTNEYLTQYLFIYLKVHCKNTIIVHNTLITCVIQYRKIYQTSEYFDF